MKYVTLTTIALVATLIIFQLGHRVFGAAFNTVAIINYRDADILVFAVRSTIDKIEKQAIVRPFDPRKFSPRVLYGNIRSRVGSQVLRIDTNSGALSCEVDISPNDCYLWIYIKNNVTKCICDDISVESGTH